MIHSTKKLKLSIGKLVKSSKQQFSWHFRINNKPHKVILKVSYVTSKLRIFVDNKIYLNTSNLKLKLNFKFTIEGVQGVIRNIKRKEFPYELSLNGRKFDNLVKYQGVQETRTERQTGRGWWESSNVDMIFGEVQFYDIARRREDVRRVREVYER